MFYKSDKQIQMAFMVGACVWIQENKGKNPSLYSPNNVETGFAIFKTDMQIAYQRQYVKNEKEAKRIEMETKKIRDKRCTCIINAMAWMCDYWSKNKRAHFSKHSREDLIEIQSGVHKMADIVIKLMSDAEEDSDA